MPIEDNTTAGRTVHSVPGPYPHVDVPAVSVVPVTMSAVAVAVTVHAAAHVLVQDLHHHQVDTQAARGRDEHDLP